MTRTSIGIGVIGFSWMKRIVLTYPRPPIARAYG